MWFGIFLLKTFTIILIQSNIFGTNDSIYNLVTCALPEGIDGSIATFCERCQEELFVYGYHWGPTP